jgi:hypothetical protein
VWVSTFCEYGLLTAWKLFGVAGAGNVLTAWVVIGGLFGVALIFGPPGGALPPDRCIFGYRIVRLLDVGMSAAFFWFGHGLLGVLWLASVLGVYSHSLRSAQHWRGSTHG